MADAHKNFAYSTVATAPSPASSGTSLVVAAGQGALFPTPPFNVTIWPAGLQPLNGNAEIARVTAKTTDTLTITRAQEGSTARAIVVGDQIAATITAKVLEDVDKPPISLSYSGTSPTLALQNTYNDAYAALQVRGGDGSSRMTVDGYGNINFPSGGLMLGGLGYQGTGLGWIGCQTPTFLLTMPSGGAGIRLDDSGTPGQGRVTFTGYASFGGALMLGDAWPGSPAPVNSPLSGLIGDIGGGATCRFAIWNASARTLYAESAYYFWPEADITPLTVRARPTFAQTADLFRVLDASANARVRVTAAGALQINADGVNLPLIIKGASPQYTPLTQWQNSSGAELLSIASNGSIALSGVAGLFITDSDGGGHKFVVKRAAAQYDFMSEWRASDDTVLSGVNVEGAFFTAVHSEPVDSSVPTGAMALWFDQTAGAPKPMVKMKDSAGVVSKAPLAGAVWGFHAGLYYPRCASGIGAGGAATVQDRLCAFPFVVHSRSKFDRVGFTCTSAASGSSCRVGIYRDDGTGWPGALHFDAGTFSTTTTGRKEWTGTLILDPGVYWLAFVAQGGTPSIYASGSPPVFCQDLILAFDDPDSNTFSVPNFAGKEGVTGALPDPMNPGGTYGSGNYCPYVFLRAA